MRATAIMTPVFFFLFIAAFVLALAAPSEGKNPPDHVYTGPWPDEDAACPAEITPVYDSRGNFYINFCEAVRQRVRVAWNDPPGD